MKDERSSDVIRSSIIKKIKHSVAHTPVKNKWLKDVTRTSTTIQGTKMEK